MYGMVRTVKSNQGQERRMVFVIDASAATLLVGSHQATLTDNGTGDFTITFANAFGRAPVAAITALESDAAGYYVNAAVGSIDVKITTLAAVAADKDVMVEVIGWDSTDEI